MLEVQYLVKYQGGARMSDYQQFLQEQRPNGFSLQKGYKIKKVKENLTERLLNLKKVRDRRHYTLEQQREENTFR